MRKSVTFIVLAVVTAVAAALLGIDVASAQAPPPNCSPILPVEFNSVINEGQSINIQVGQTAGCSDPRITDKVFVNDSLPVGLRIDRSSGLISGVVGVQQFNPTNWSIRLITTFEEGGQLLTWEASASTTTVMGGAAPEATPTPTVTPAPQATSAPQATPTPRPTAAPTATPRPQPTATPRPQPTATPRPTATAVPAPTSTPAPEPTASPEATGTDSDGDGSSGTSGPRPTPQPSALLDTLIEAYGQPPVDNSTVGAFSLNGRPVWYWFDSDQPVNVGSDSTVSIFFEAVPMPPGETWDGPDAANAYVRLLTDESAVDVADPDQWVTVTFGERTQTDWELQAQEEQDLELELLIEADGQTWRSRPAEFAVAPTTFARMSDWVVDNSLFAFLGGLGLAFIVAVVVSWRRRKAAEAIPVAHHHEPHSSNPFQY